MTEADAEPSRAIEQLLSDKGGSSTGRTIWRAQLACRIASASQNISLGLWVRKTPKLRFHSRSNQNGEGAEVGFAAETRRRKTWLKKPRGAGGPREKCGKAG